MAPIKVVIKKTHGGIRAYPEDTWTKKFLEVFERGLRKCFTLDQLMELQKLGFQIVHKEEKI